MFYVLVEAKYLLMLRTWLRTCAWVWGPKESLGFSSEIDKK